jgi:hypothetical protein
MVALRKVKGRPAKTVIGWGPVQNPETKARYNGSKARTLGAEISGNRGETLVFIRPN